MASSTVGRRALITGVTGQDGAYLAPFLLAQGYEVHGIKRRSSSFNTGRIEDIYQDPHELHQRFVLHYGDLTDSTNLIRIVQEVQPTEIYNLASKPDGTPRKLMSGDKIAAMGWRPKIGLRQGIEQAYGEFLAGTVKQR